MRRRQEKENKRFSDYYSGRKREIQAPPEKIQPRSGSKGKVVDRKAVDEEKKRLNEIEARDKRVLDNKQKRELEKLKKKPKKNER